MLSLAVSALALSFRRAGRQFTRETSIVPLAECTPDQAIALLSEKELVCDFAVDAEDGEVIIRPLDEQRAELIALLGNMPADDGIDTDALIDSLKPVVAPAAPAPAPTPSPTPTAKDGDAGQAKTTTEPEKVAPEKATDEKPAPKKTPPKKTAKKTAAKGGAKDSQTGGAD